MFTFLSDYDRWIPVISVGAEADAGLAGSAAAAAAGAQRLCSNE